MYIVQSAMECILLRCSWVIGDLHSRLVLRAILVDIQIGTFSKAMMERLWSWRRKIVMDVRKTTAVEQSDSTRKSDRLRGVWLALLTWSKDAPRLVAEAWLSVNIKKKDEAKEK